MFGNVGSDAGSGSGAGAGSGSGAGAGAGSDAGAGAVSFLRRLLGFFTGGGGGIPA